MARNMVYFEIDTDTEAMLDEVCKADPRNHQFEDRNRSQELRILIRQEHARRYPQIPVSTETLAGITAEDLSIADLSARKVKK